MKTAKNNRNISVTSDIHLRNVFVSDSYLELGIVDIDVMQRLLNNEIINLNDIVYFPNQNKGIGHLNISNELLSNYVPHFFFFNLSKNTINYELAITYGLLRQRTLEGFENFLPIFLIPIKLYYEDNLVNDETTFGGFDSINSLKVQLAKKPIFNPMLQTLFQQNLNVKFQLTTSLDFTRIEALDYALELISNINEGDISVSLDNYLTYY